MKQSLVFPVRMKPEEFAESTRDLHSFWQRFPVETEIVLALEPAKGHELLEYDKIVDSFPATAHLSWKKVFSKSRRTRGQAILAGINHSSGEILAVNSLDLEIPLAEMFSGLQEFILNREQSFLLIGNRLGSKKKRQKRKQGLRSFFEGVEHEKSLALELQDPTCPFFMIKKKDWDRLELQKLPKWFYTPQVALACRKKGISIHELEIQVRENPQSQFRFFFFS